ncbi:hypothetical protein O9992_21105 [Vibrio lentus]|nr:hypothetical protein [Vibrio lentus]
MMWCTNTQVAPQKNKAKTSRLSNRMEFSNIYSLVSQNVTGITCRRRSRVAPSLTQPSSKKAAVGLFEGV